jgi:polyvinyl alcohol dehydrogenase (cytochrome)
MGIAPEQSCIRGLRTVAAAILMAGMGLAAQAPAGGWPMVNHDAANSRSTSVTRIAPDNVSRLKPALTIMAGGNVWATPVIADNGLYFTDSGGNVSKVEAGTGQVVWSHPVAFYDGIAKATSRGGAALVDGLLVFGDQNGAHLIAVDAATGAKRWMTQLDAHPEAIITGAPIAVGDRVYVGVSSHEGTRFLKDPNATSDFRGSLVAVDVHTGKILWRTYTMPAGAGWSGGAVMSVPAADPSQGRVYFGTDHQYTMPKSVTDCLNAAPNDWSATCLPPEARFDSLVAVDMQTGKPQWTFFGGGADVWRQACGNLPTSTEPFLPAAELGVAQPVRVCPPVNDYLDWAFAAGSPQLFNVMMAGAPRAVVGMAQKSGVYWLFDAKTGNVIWHTLIGPYSEPGGLTWGAAYDGHRLYVTLTNLDHVPFRLASGAIASGGAWTALDPATGKILWQTEDPQHAADYAAPVVANGVVYTGSMAASGDQMYALDAATGKILWRFAAGASVASNPAVVGGRIYWGTGFNLFGAKAGNKLYVFSLDGRQSTKSLNTKPPARISQ